MSDIKIQHLRMYNDIYEYMIPERIGTYVITHTINNIHVEKYVGATKSLYLRMHSQDHHTKKIMYVDLYITDDIDLAESLERILISLIKPATNKIMQSLSDKDMELMKELLEDTIIKEHVSEKIMKIGHRYLKYINGNEKSLKKISTNTKIKKDKLLLLKVRRARKSGGSIIITLTDFLKEDVFYIVTKNGNDVILTNIKLEDHKTELYPKYD